MSTEETIRQAEVIASAVLAVCMFIVAAYRTWKPEHQKRCALEAELNSAADLRGRIEICVQENPPAYVTQAFAGTNLQYFCECSNHGRKACTVSYLVIELTPVTGAKSEHKIPVQPVPKHLEYTDAFKYEGICRIPVLPEDIASSKVNVYLLDSLGEAHRKPTTRFYPSCSSSETL